MIYCIAGKNEIAIFGLNLLLDLGIAKENILVLCNSTDNGNHTWQPSFKKYCHDQQIKEVQLKDVYDIEELIFISLEYDKIIKTGLFKSNRIYNIHFSLLPAFKGMYTSIFPILNGESKSGVTLHRIDDGIDTGDIIEQKEFSIPFGINGYNLYMLYIKYSKLLLKENIQSIIKSEFICRPQEILNASYYSKKSIDFNNIKINFFKTAFEICNYVNAFSFRPYQFSQFNEFNIVKAIPVNEKTNLKPGKIVNENLSYLEISTIDYNVRLLKDRLVDILEASQYNRLFKIKEFYHLGYDLNDKNEKGWNALIVSAYSGAEDVLRFLLDKNSPVNSVNNNGTNVLMYAMTNASKTGDLSSMKLLIEKGANTKHKDLEGLDVLYYAKKYENTKVINYLKSIVEDK